MTTLCPYNGYCQNKTDMGYCGITGGCSKRFPSRVIYTFNVDAVEVVRCKNCKHLNKEEMRCFEVEGLGYRNVSGYDFCSRAVRKDEVEE